MLSSRFSSGSRIIIPSSVSYHTTSFFREKHQQGCSLFSVMRIKPFISPEDADSVIGKTSMIMSRTCTSNSHRTQPFLKDDLLSWEEETFNFNFMIPPPSQHPPPKPEYILLASLLGKPSTLPASTAESFNASWRGTDRGLISSFG